MAAGAAIFVVQALVVRIEPAIGAVSGAAAGMLAVLVLRMATGRARPAVVEGAHEPAEPADTHVEVEPTLTQRQALLVLLPYAVLVVSVLIVYLPNASRTWVKGNLLVGPSFSPTVTELGHTNPAVGPYTPIALLGHPATYLVLSGLVAWLVWVRLGTWPRGQMASTLAAWWRQALKSSPPVLLLATVATVMADTGMVRAIALGVADVTGDAFPVVAPSIGMLGAFTTGSTTSSNALFAALQAQVADLIDVPRATLLAAQLAGGNAGNIIAPMVLAVGTAGLGIRSQLGKVLRLVIVPALLLNVAVVAVTFAFLA